ncbi:MAG: DUF1553 domain-containing protein [Verrucomicrobiales bacterium]|nr:DUF1553 domain-containing protein [Verrucomicrobiales bacterium]
MKHIAWMLGLLVALKAAAPAATGVEGGSLNPSSSADHWAFQPVRYPQVPDQAGGRSGSQSAGASVNHSPIDAFVLQRLTEKGLTLAPEADRATLLRRLSFDLTGLPPTPEEVASFVRDPSPAAYERWVERLLASPAYGERWGRHWLDVVRYTESQGFEYDRLRDNAWHYRDYVIRSFNEDKPYDLFIREQIAGDVLEPITRDGIIGASLLVCGPYDEAGNNQANMTQRAITREEEMEDLVSVVGQTFLGLTLNCARCHSHKFDPISLADYYRIKAVFDGVKHGERPLATPAESKAREDRLAEWQRMSGEAKGVVDRLEHEGRFRAAARRQPQAAVVPGPAPYRSWNFGKSDTTPMGGRLHGGAQATDMGLRLAGSGAFFESDPLDQEIREKTLEAWVDLQGLDQRGGAAISIESTDGSVFDAVVFGEREPRRWTAGSNGFERTRDLGADAEDSGAGTWIHVAAVYRADHSIAVFRNGAPYGRPYTPDGRLRTFPAGKSRILLGKRHTGGGNPYLTGAIRHAALYDRALSAEEVAASFRGGDLRVPLEEALAELSASQRAEREAALERARRAREGLAAEEPVPVSYAGTRFQPAPTRQLRRGDVRTPGDVVTPAALPAIQGLAFEFGLGPEAPEAQRRLRFAEWLTDPRNPLPARVMMNRLWQFHFGQGLVATPNDFGRSGSRPTHPELLDWLASAFVNSGWSIKSMHRWIVLSATYRQASNPPGAGPDTAATASAFAKAMAMDAENTLWWRFPPRRLEAEAVRDAVLAVSGQLNRTAGGPSFRPFEILRFPANAYQPVDKVGAEFDRRSVYRMNVNSGKEPLLDAFDCPDPAVKTPRRGVTTTPLQALSLMNHPFVQRHAALLAERALDEASGEIPEAINVAYRRALGRPPNVKEAAQALAVARERGLVPVCWALLNTTEFVYVR